MPCLAKTTLAFLYPLGDQFEVNFPLAPFFSLAVMNINDKSIL